MIIEEEGEVTWEDMNFLEHCLFIIEFPLDFLRRITMPPCEAEKYNKILCIVWPFPGLLFTLWGLDML
jgi:hypothetical protein